MGQFYRTLSEHRLRIFAALDVLIDLGIAVRKGMPPNLCSDTEITAFTALKTVSAEEKQRSAAIDQHQFSLTVYNDHESENALIFYSIVFNLFFKEVYGEFVWRYCGLKTQTFHSMPGVGRGRTPGNSWLVCAARFSKCLTLFQTKKCNFPHPFSELALRQKLYYYLD